MLYLKRILLVAILLVPILWVWPQRGVTVKFYPDRNWATGPAVERVERQINLDFMTATSASLPQQDFSVEWSGWLRTDRDGQYAFELRSDDSSTLELDGQLIVDAGGVAFPTTRAATIPLTQFHKGNEFWQTSYKTSGATASKFSDFTTTEIAFLIANDLPAAVATSSINIAIDNVRIVKNP